MQHTGELNKGSSVKFKHVHGATIGVSGKHSTCNLLSSIDTLVSVYLYMIPCASIQTWLKFFSATPVVAMHMRYVILFTNEDEFIGIVCCYLYPIGGFNGG